MAAHAHATPRIQIPFALRTSGLTVGYSGSEALSNVDLEVPPGKTVAVLGPNGAGKTTLLHALVGLVSPRAGSIELGGETVSLVPQELEVERSFPVTATEVVRMGRYPSVGWIGRFGAEDHRLVSEALETLGVTDLGNRRFGELSGGERRRVLLAQATAQDADLLLLDEPFSGVDVPTSRAVRELIERWRSEGRTLMVATHDLESAARDYDLVLALNGRVVAFGPPQTVLTEEILAETFAGRVVRVGELLIDVAHHHHGAG
jgi:ABC-type Mn2+/Zn2+ transport system ATPase subunit